MAKFESGNPGRAKGTKNKISQDARKLFLSVMEGEVDHIQGALAKLRVGDPEKYLLCLSKFFPYFTPKKLEIDNPTELIVHVKRKGS